LRHDGCARRAATGEARADQAGRVGYLVLYLMGVPVGVLLLLWVLFGSNLIGPGLTDSTTPASRSHRVAATPAKLDHFARDRRAHPVAAADEPSCSAATARRSVAARGTCSGVPSTEYACVI
jgi:hypothetical protein